jgi:hypothetical protein
MIKRQDFLVDDIRQILQDARQKTYTAINFAMVEAYWNIGRRIVEEEQHGKERADYGARLIKKLAQKLTSEFGSGFSLANLKNFRQFYLTFPDFEKSYTLRSQLTWSHYRLIMRVSNPKAREYYISEAASQNALYSLTSRPASSPIRISDRWICMSGSMKTP